MSTAGTIQDPSRDLPVTAPHEIGAPVYITTAETLPTADLLATIPPEMTADLNITPNTANTNQPKDHQQQHETSSQKYEDRKQKPKQVIIDNPLSDYYSSDESENDLEDDLN